MFMMTNKIQLYSRVLSADLTLYMSRFSGSLFAELRETEYKIKTICCLDQDWNINSSYEQRRLTEVRIMGFQL